MIKQHLLKWWSENVQIQATIVKMLNGPLVSRAQYILGCKGKMVSYWEWLKNLNKPCVCPWSIRITWVRVPKGYSEWKDQNEVFLIYYGRDYSLAGAMTHGTPTLMSVICGENKGWGTTSPCPGAMNNLTLLGLKFGPNLEASDLLPLFAATLYVRFLFVCQLTQFQDHLIWYFTKLYLFEWVDQAYLNRSQSKHDQCSILERRWTPFDYWAINSTFNPHWGTRQKL